MVAMAWLLTFGLLTGTIAVDEVARLQLGECTLENSPGTNQIVVSDGCEIVNAPTSSATTSEIAQLREELETLRQALGVVPPPTSPPPSPLFPPVTRPTVTYEGSLMPPVDTTTPLTVTGWSHSWGWDGSQCDPANAGCTQVTFGSALTGVVADDLSAQCVMHTDINSGTRTFVLDSAAQAYLLRWDGQWSTVPTTGWSYVSTGEYLHGYGNVICLYSRLLPAGTYSLHTTSAMYLFCSPS